MRKDRDNSVGLHFERTDQVFYFCNIFLPYVKILSNCMSLHNFCLMLPLKENSEICKNCSNIND